MVNLPVSNLRLIVNNKEYTLAALAAVEENAFLNGIEVDQLSSENLIGNDCSDVDVILVGDMLYDAEFATSVLPWLQLLVARLAAKIFYLLPSKIIFYYNKL